ncbi:Copine-4 [Bonamia ostreae]|uniref:Copine-4 n=1 Tax=Bonamia ostreae TaxID=126728 RepID=A0ABV2AQ32_9EUKA
MSCYKDTLQRITLGPSKRISEIIRDVISYSKSSSSPNEYTVAFILTTSANFDTEDTFRELENASGLPISFVFIGIGPGDFSNLKNMLNKKKSKNYIRKNYDFVSHEKIKRSVGESTVDEKLSHRALGRINSQFLQHKKLRSIRPNKPDMNPLMRVDLVAEEHLRFNQKLIFAQQQQQQQKPIQPNKMQNQTQLVQPSQQNQSVQSNVQPEKSEQDLIVEKRALDAKLNENLTKMSIRDETEKFDKQDLLSEKTARLERKVEEKNNAKQSLAEKEIEREKQQIEEEKKRIELEKRKIEERRKNEIEERRILEIEKKNLEDEKKKIEQQKNAKAKKGMEEKNELEDVGAKVEKTIKTQSAQKAKFERMEAQKITESKNSVSDDILERIKSLKKELPVEKKKRVVLNDLE